MPSPEETPQTVLYQKNYDKETQHQIEDKSTSIIKSITGYCIEVGTNNITEASAVAWIMANTAEVIQMSKQLYNKYHEELKPLDPNHKNGDMVMTEGFKFITDLETALTGTYQIDAHWLIDKLKALQRYEIRDIAVKHKLMDRTSELEPWEKDVKKKFFLNEVQEEIWAPHEEYLNHINKRWKRLVFLETAYMVLKNGDIVKLISGVNNSGKTWTMIPQLRWANWLFMNYWAKIANPDLKYKDGKAVYPPDVIAGLQAVKPFRMKENIMFYPEPEKVTQKVGDGSRFNVIAINEGMKAAINLRSWEPDVIDMILEIFTERASNNYMTFEYQLTKRPPKLLLSRFNVWEHKPGQKWMVVSMPSSVYRTEDPLYSKELEKIKGDRKISSWLTHRSQNNNFIAKMLAPKISPKTDARFKKLRKEAKAEYDKGKSVKKRFGSSWFAKLDEYHKNVSEGKIAYMQLPDMLKEKHRFNDEEVKKFMRDYDKYARNYKLEHPDETYEADAG